MCRTRPPRTHAWQRERCILWLRTRKSRLDATFYAKRTLSVVLATRNREEKTQNSLCRAGVFRRAQGDSPVPSLSHGHYRPLICVQAYLCQVIKDKRWRDCSDSVICNLRLLPTHAFFGPGSQRRGSKPTTVWLGQPRLVKRFCQRHKLFLASRHH